MVGFWARQSVAKYESTRQCTVLVTMSNENRSQVRNTEPMIYFVSKKWLMCLSAQSLCLSAQEFCARQSVAKYESIRQSTVLVTMSNENKSRVIMRNTEPIICFVSKKWLVCLSAQSLSVCTGILSRTISSTRQCTVLVTMLNENKLRLRNTEPMICFVSKKWLVCQSAQSFFTILGFKHMQWACVFTTGLR